MPSILLTGCAGFIGSNFVEYFLKKYPNYKIINFDSLTYAGDLKNIKKLKTNPRYTFVKGDISNRKHLEKIFKLYNIHSVINFAAETHVDNSIKKSDIFIKTNILGTHTLIDVSYKNWMIKPFHFRKSFEDSRYLQVSTDEVYGSIKGKNLFSEKSSYAPNSPYSASKASADFIVRSYNKTYGINSVITCSSNNYGPMQNDEKLIPTIIRKALNNEPIPIYGDGKNIRDWMYVQDHCEGIDLAFHKGKKGETYNIGSNYELTNLQVVNKICKSLNKLVPRKYNYLSLIKFVNDRPGHDKRYAIDSTKLRKELGWKIKTDHNDGFLATVKWYLKKYGKK